MVIVKCLACGCNVLNDERHVQGKVTETALRQLFDQALGSAFPHLVVPGAPPCCQVLHCPLICASGVST